MTIDPRHGVYQLRRIAQTPKTFANWPTVLGDMARERLGRGPDDLTFVTRTGLRIQCPNRPGARVPLYEIFAEDCYKLEWLLGSLRTRPIRVVDIGGHVGTFANRLAQLNPAARITSYEPSRTTASFLRRNLAANGFADRASVVEAAVAAESGTAVFDDNGAGSGLNGLVDLGHTSGTATEVQAISFDDIVASETQPVDLVKIDCEGGEYDLVLSSSPGGWESVERVVIEHHPVQGHDFAELERHFAGLGLTVQHAVSHHGFGCTWLSREPLPAAT